MENWQELEIAEIEKTFSETEENSIEALVPRATETGVQSPSSIDRSSLGFDPSELTLPKVSLWENNENGLPQMELENVVESFREQKALLVEITDDLVGDTFKNLERMDNLIRPTIIEQEGYNVDLPVQIDQLNLENYVMPAELAGALRDPDMDQIEMLSEAVHEPETHITLPAPLYKMLEPAFDLLNMDTIPVPSSDGKLVELVKADPSNPPKGLEPYINPRHIAEPPSAEDQIPPEPSSPPPPPAPTTA